MTARHIVMKNSVRIATLAGCCREGLQSAANSTDRRNTLSEFLCWRLILQGLVGAFVKLPCDCAEFCLGMDG
jgi:hypothetical protein